MRQRVYSLLTLLCLLAGAGLSAFSSFALAYTLDLTENWWIWILVYLSCLTGVLILSWTGKLLYHRVYENWLTRVQDGVFKVQLTGRALLYRDNASRLFTFATNDVNILRNTFCPALFATVQSSLNFLASLVAMLVFQIWFGLAFLAGVVILFPILWEVSHKLKEIYARKDEIESSYYAKMDDYSSGLREFRHASRLDLLKEVLKRRSETFVRDLRRAKAVGNLVRFLGTIASEVLICGSIGLLVYLGLRGDIAIGALIALLQLLIVATEFVDTLVESLSDITEARPIFKKRRVLLEGHGEKIHVDALRVENLSFINAQGNKIFKPVSFVWKGGDKLLLEGTNGIGKSVLSASLAGYTFLPRQGIISSGDKELPEIFIPEEVSYYCGEDIYIESLESQGEKQLRVLEEALSGPDQFIVLDELLSDLDDETREEALERIKRSDKGIILIDHLPDGDTKFDRIDLEVCRE